MVQSARLAGSKSGVELGARLKTRPTAKRGAMEGTGQAAAIEESILAAARIMVNILAESLLREGVEQNTDPQFRRLDMVQSLSD